jgi:hypothetical protein
VSWSYVASGAAGNGNNASSLAPGLPAGIQAGDLLVLQVQTFGGTSARTPSTPSGWTAFDGSNGFTQNGTSAHGFWYRIATGSDSAPTITMSGTGAANDTQVSKIHAFRSSRGPANAPVTVGSWSTNASADDIGPITGITVPSAANGGNVLTLISAGKANDFNGNGSLTNYTESSLTESTTGNDAGMTLMYRLSTPSGATGSLTVTDNGGTASAGVGIGVIVAFDEPLLLSPTGSEGTAESQGGAFLDVNIIPYVPSDSGATESGTPVYSGSSGTTVFPTGSEGTSESGTPATPFTVPGTGSEATAESGTPVRAFTVPGTGSEATSESGTPAQAFVVPVAGTQADTEANAPQLAGTYPATGSEASGESGTAQALQAGTLAPTGNELTSESGTPVYSGGGVYAASGSEVTAESQGGAFLDVNIIPYVPSDSGTTQSTTGAVGHTYPASGSEATSESGTAVAQIGGTLVVLGTGSEATAEADAAFDVFDDILPDGSELSIETGTIAALWRLLPPGSEVTSESSPPTVQQAAGAITPAGVELTAQSGLVDYVPDEIILTPNGQELVAESSSPLLAGVITVTGEELLIQSGTATIGVGGLTLLPAGSELAIESGVPLLLGVLIPTGSEVSVQVTDAILRGVSLALGLTVRGVGAPQYRVIGQGRVQYLIVFKP